MKLHHTSYTWRNVKAGKNNFSVQLANNDATPIPLVSKDINVIFVAVTTYLLGTPSQS
jgi:hypothetical protein